MAMMWSSLCEAPLGLRAEPRAGLGGTSLKLSLILSHFSALT